MQKYAKIEKGVVVQVQPYPEKGFKAVPKNTVCGMVKGKHNTFSAPPRKAKKAQSKDLKDDGYTDRDYINAIMAEMNYRRLQGDKMTQDMDDALGRWLLVNKDKGA
jgi:hypothetical protein